MVEMVMDELEKKKVTYLLVEYFMQGSRKKEFREEIAKEVGIKNSEVDTLLKHFSVQLFRDIGSVEQKELDSYG